MNFILYSYWVCTCYRLCGNQGKQRMFVLLCGLKRLSLYAMITTKIPALLFEENFIIMDVIPFGPICSYLICWVVLISKLSSTKCGVSAGSMIIMVWAWTAWRKVRWVKFPRLHWKPKLNPLLFYKKKKHLPICSVRASAGEPWFYID